MSRGGRKSRPMPRIIAEARKLEAAFNAGDVLAAFECCAVWKREELPAEHLPPWVLRYLVEAAATYFADSPFTRMTPREFASAEPDDRDRVLPSLDEAAGLRARKGKFGAWFERAQMARYRSIEAYIDDRIKTAKAGGPNSVQDTHGRDVLILNMRGQPRTEFYGAVSELFNVYGYDPTISLDNKGRALRRKLRHWRKRHQEHSASLI